MNVKKQKPVDGIKVHISDNMWFLSIRTKGSKNYKSLSLMYDVDDVIAKVTMLLKEHKPQSVHYKLSEE